MAVTRRSLIKGLSLGAGAAVLSPILAQLELHAEGSSGAAVQLPKRFVFVVPSSGILPETVEPTTLGDLVADTTKYCNVSLEKHTLEPSMQPFEPLKKYLSIIQGLSGKMCAGGHTSNYGALGVWRAPGEGGAPLPKRATADAKLAKLFPAAINHLATGLTGNWGTRVTEGVVYPDISAAGPQMTIPFQASPDIVFEQLFGTVASHDKYMDRKLLCKRNLLDFMTDDVKKLQKTLPGQERQKLDHYLRALEDLQGQDTKIASMRASLAKHAPKIGEKYTSEVIEERQEAHFDLIAAALISGITNVATMKIDNSAMNYGGLGIGDISVHGIGHNEGANGKTGLECRNMIRQHHFDLIAQLANKLMRVPEGTGNMLDNTLIVYISDSANKHHATLEEWPIITLGGGGGKLKIPGRYIRFPSYGQSNHKTIGNWWTSVLNAYGDPVPHYGDFDPGLMKGGLDQKGPIADMIA